MRCVRLVVCAVALVCGLTGLRPGPLATSARAQRTTFSGGIDLVPIYATVTDRRGALVPNLTVRDFAVRDDIVVKVRRDTKYEVHARRGYQGG